MKRSCGLLMCRFTDQLEFFLVHPGGPFFKNKDLGHWTIPKGLPEDNEDLLQAAVREFEEETGLTAFQPFYSLGNIDQKGGKKIFAWGFMGAWTPDQGIKSNTFTTEWPPKSKRTQTFPEIDKAAWMIYEDAVKAINPAQIPLLDRATVIFKSPHELMQPKF